MQKEPDRYPACATVSHRPNFSSQLTILYYNDDIPCKAQKISEHIEECDGSPPKLPRPWAIAKRTPRRAVVHEPKTNHAKKLRTSIAKEKANMLCQNVYGELKELIARGVDLRVEYQLMMFAYGP